MITKIEIHEFRHQIPDMGYDEDGFNMVYEPGGRLQAGGQILRLCCVFFSCCSYR